MRQAGVLAAAGMIALEEMPKRLHEDHANAKLMAQAISRMPQAIIDVATVQTNIVIFDSEGRGRCAGAGSQNEAAMGCCAALLARIRCGW